MEKKKIGVLTGGGDAPGLNAVIRAVVVKGEKLGYEIIGIKDGWRGLLNKNVEEISIDKVEDIHREGGTILGTSRTNPYKEEGGEQKAIENMNQLGLHALVAIGGDDTLGVANKLSKKGVKVVGVPKTIDNDLSATDICFGFDTAINRVSEAIDSLHTTAKSHHRVLVVEVMGRHAGWIALEGGIAGGAHVILIPEEPFNIDEVCKVINKRKENGKLYSIIAVAEGALPKGGDLPASCESKQAGKFFTQSEGTDSFGHVKLGGIAKALEKEIENRTGIETRSVILGHLQRGGSPSAFDRYFATRLGLKAIDMVKKEEFGKMAALRKGELVSVPLEEAVGE
ncbi:MAG: 6-phosphofructokinase, partial [Candidatus Omnitrophica bacterium]|nr:6-phosphofructokinase [Candidatus Omnitrophota bacterium]